MKNAIKYIAFLLIIPALCNCGAEQCIHRTEDGLYTYNNLIYKNDGEIFLSEKEREYVEQIAEFQDGMKGAEWYTCASQYGRWVLLELEESRYIQGMDGHRFFLLIPNTDKGREEYEIGDGMIPLIYCNGTQYQYDNSVDSENVTGDMEVLGFVQTISEGNQIPDDNIQTNLAILMGHLAYRNGEKVLVSADGGETYSVFTISKNQR